jgi:hypothetical protein
LLRHRWLKPVNTKFNWYQTILIIEAPDRNHLLKQEGKKDRAEESGVCQWHLYLNALYSKDLYKSKQPDVN